MAEGRACKDHQTKGIGLLASFIERFKPILASECEGLISQKDKENEELQRSIEEDERIVDDESQD